MVRELKALDSYLSFRLHTLSCRYSYLHVYLDLNLCLVASRSLHSLYGEHSILDFRFKVFTDAIEREGRRFNFSHQSTYSFFYGTDPSSIPSSSPATQSSDSAGPAVTNPFTGGNEQTISILIHGENRICNICTLGNQIR